MSTFNKIYKKVANNGDNNDYQVVGQVGVNGVPLDIMKGASSSSDGVIGLVPKPNKGQQNKYLRADGTWAEPTDTNTTYDVFTGNNNGLVPSTDKSTLFLTGNGTWGYPWVGSWTESGKTIICLGSGDDQLSKNEIPEASASSNGLMSKDDYTLIKNLLHNRFILVGWIDTKYSSNAVKLNETHYFNQENNGKVYKSSYPEEYATYLYAMENNLDIRYEPRLTGCTFGMADNISNGANPVLSKGSDSKGEYINIKFYITGTLRNLSNGTHTMTVQTSTDFYVRIPG